MKIIKNIIGWIRGYGGCEHCKDSWYWKKEKIIFIGKRGGITKSAYPLCEECFNKLSYSKCLDYFMKHTRDVAEFINVGLRIAEEKNEKHRRIIYV